jgi:hypothetical protein
MFGYAASLYISESLTADKSTIQLATFLSHRRRRPTRNTLQPFGHADVPGGQGIAVRADLTEEMLG